ncbi:major facilitator superfamily domain-containing protein 3-like [Mercenaria mercenaria]|uniref:major facilitator superfamily domain-containing protein 3-like n=1 Tax=Mercenaria mercenaria TaxID=6596 RepID=UPI00234F1265|nr:major facilitator superfamily domain-containing protein 3-like [Mercenaria mercenaria]
MISQNVSFLAFLYFLQGIPYGLQSRFLPLYFRSHGMSLSNIGYFKLLLIPWVSKALWAPLVDHYGTKKIWLSYSMVGLCGTCVLGSFTSPEFIAQIAFVLLLFNFLTATQDIAVDGLAIQILATSELASGNIAQVVGYKFGAVFSGGFLAWLSDLSWGILFIGLAMVYLLAYFVVLKVVPDHSTPDKNDRMSSDDNSSAKTKEKSNSIEDKDWKNKKDHWIVEHIKMVLAEEETRWTLLYVFIYKLGEQGALTMMPLFLVDRGITSSSVGFWTGLVGQGVSIFGSFLGGWLVSIFWYTPHRVLLFCSVIRPVILTFFVILVAFWPDGGQFSQHNYYACVVFCFLVLLLGSGVVTTTTFTLMMYCSQRSPSSVQASHYTTMATVEVLGKLSFSVVIGQFTDIVGYLSSFALFVILSLFVIPILLRCPMLLVEMNRNRR